MSGTSDFYDSDSETDDEILEVVDAGLNHVGAQQNLQDLCQHYAHADGELPWRVLMHASDTFVLWSCATGLAWRGPTYSSETTENGTPVLLEHGKYVSTRGRTPCLQTLFSAVKKRLTTNEMEEFEEELFNDEPDPYKIVGFITEVLRILSLIHI